MKGRAIVLALAAFLLVGISALIAMMGMQRTEGTSYLPSGVSPADLPEPGSRGAEVVTRYCRSCHGVPHPALHTPGDWPGVVDDMLARTMSRVMAPLPMPSPAERDELLAYLQRHASGAPAAVPAAGAQPAAQADAARADADPGGAAQVDAARGSAVQVDAPQVDAPQVDAGQADADEIPSAR